MLNISEFLDTCKYYSAFWSTVNVQCTTNNLHRNFVFFCIKQMPSETPMEAQVTEPSKASETQEVTVPKTPITPSSATSAYAAEFLKFVGVLLNLTACNK